MVYLLLKHNAEVNVKDTSIYWERKMDSYSALHYAAANGNVDTAISLIKAGAKVNGLYR